MEVVVIVVPFPAQSHLNQLLQFSCLISTYNIPVHYVASTIHTRQVKLRFNNHLIDTSKIHFHELPTPPFASPPPNPNSTSNFPSHFSPSMEASLQLRQPVAELLHNLSTTATRIVVIHDNLMDFVVQDVSSIPNGESYVFHPFSPFRSFFDQWELLGKPFPIENVPQGLPSVEGCFSSEFENFAAVHYDYMNVNSGNIHHTCRFIDATYIDLLEKIRPHKKQWAIGPINPVTIISQGGGTGRIRNYFSNNDQLHKSLEWLDKQSPKSVMFVCFGTTISMADEQIKELAMGLEQSGQKFIWVLRDADKGNIFVGVDDDKRVEQLPEEGYEERVKEVGMVVRDWAPQLDILGHPSTGGFMSHCGWNSCMESFTMGVPIATWPMHCDQPKNAFLVTDILKVGLVVKRWTSSQRELVSSSAIAKAVKTLMASKEGEEVRNRAEKFGRAVRESMKEGGVSRMELDSFITHITR